MSTFSSLRTAGATGVTVVPPSAGQFATLQVFEHESQFAFALLTLTPGASGKSFDELGLTPALVGTKMPKLVLTSGVGVIAVSSDGATKVQLSSSSVVSLKPKNGSFGQKIVFSADKNFVVGITVCVKCTEDTCPDECGGDPDPGVPEDPNGGEEERAERIRIVLG